VNCVVFPAVKVSPMRILRENSGTFWNYFEMFSGIFNFYFVFILCLQLKLLYQVQKSPSADAGVTNCTPLSNNIRERPRHCSRDLRCTKTYLEYLGESCVLTQLILSCFRFGTCMTLAISSAHNAHAYNFSSRSSIATGNTNKAGKEIPVCKESFPRAH